MCISDVFSTQKFPAEDPALQALPVSWRSLATPGYSSLTLRILCGLNSTQNAYALPLHRCLVDAKIKNRMPLIELL